MKPLSEVIVEQVDKAVKGNAHVKKIPNAAIRNAVIQKVRDDVLTYKVDQLLKRPVDKVVGAAVEDILTDLKLLSAKPKVKPLSARPSATISSGSKPGGGGKGSSSYSAPIRSGSGGKGGGKIGYVDTREAAINMASGSPSSLKPVYGRFTKPII